MSGYCIARRNGFSCESLLVDAGGSETDKVADQQDQTYYRLHFVNRSHLPKDCEVELVEATTHSSPLHLEFAGPATKDGGRTWLQRSLFRLPPAPPGGKTDNWARKSVRKVNDQLIKEYIRTRVRFSIYTNGTLQLTSEVFL